MNKYRSIKDVTIGLSDGLIIPFALAAGLSSVISSSSTIIIACLTAAVAGALTMTFGGYIEGKKYKTSGSPLRSALIIGSAYAMGGVIITVPYYFIGIPLSALQWSACITLTLLFATGYIENIVHNNQGWHGGVRAVTSGALVAGAAFLISGLFR